MTNIQWLAFVIFFVLPVISVAIAGLGLLFTEYNHRRHHPGD